MKPTMKMDMNLVHDIANTLGLIADGLMDGHLTPTVGNDDKALEVKKNLLMIIESQLQGIETAAHLEMMATKVKIDAMTSELQMNKLDNVILFPASVGEA
tara:strand:+ start:3074 stop:3373 length:300 start_codon:yes stop_codon:yes gene_type:complete